jgi:hypothetical protein
MDGHLDGVEHQVDLASSRDHFRPEMEWRQ